MKRRGRYANFKITLLILAICAFLAVNVFVLATAFSAQKSGRTVKTIEIAFSDLPDPLLVGQETDIAVSVEPENAQCALSWSSSDENVLAVSNGRVTAKGSGCAVITASDTTTGVSCSASVTVAQLDGDYARGLVERVCDTYAQTDAVAALENAAAVKFPDGSEQAQLADTLNALCACAGDNGLTSQQVSDAAALLDTDDDTVRLAAECIHYRSQMSEDSITFSFVGDCSLCYINETDYFPSVYKASGSLTYPFDRVKHVFAADDMTLINFEGALAEKGSPSADKRFHLRGEAEYAAILPPSFIEAANLANNHSLDYFEKGFERTEKLLTEQNVAVVYGTSPYVTEIKGTEVVLLSGGEWKTPENYAECTARMLEQIKQYKRQDNIVICSLHWGGEYVVQPQKNQIDTAHSLIDAGADMLVCHHAHIIQGIELYNGRVIAYGLGNFSFGGNRNLREAESMILRATFSAGEGGAVEMDDWCVVPCSATSTGSNANNYQPITLYGDDAKRMMSVLRVRSDVISKDTALPYYYHE